MSTAPKTPAPRTPERIRSLAELGEWIDRSLTALEEQFLAFQTRSSLKRSLRRSRKGPTTLSPRKS